MAYPDAIIYSFSTEGIQPINYLDTEHYKVTRLFLDRRDQMLRELLAETDDP
jgi:predicted ATPase